MLALVSDLPAVTQRILHLREVMPSLNLSALLAQYPWCAPWLGHCGWWDVQRGGWGQGERSQGCPAHSDQTTFILQGLAATD